MALAAIDDVRTFWETNPCGAVYGGGRSAGEQLLTLSEARYTLEPYIPMFARFAEGLGRDVLEIGVGLGADHRQWALAQPRSLTGVDLTQEAIGRTQAAFHDLGLSSDLRVEDAENLPFADSSFDLVYSWGVIHHSPNTDRAADEIRRVLRHGGQARVAMYHRPSLVGIMLWMRYALLGRKPLTTLREVYARHLESPGTQAFTLEESRALFSRFSDVTVRPQLSFGDLLEGEVGRRHQGGLLCIGKRVWPRPLIRRFGAALGGYVLVEATK